MLLKIPYGKGELALNLPDSYQVDVIAPRTVAATGTSEEVVAAALDVPQGNVSLENFARARSAAIAINDKTRPLSVEALRPLLARLEKMGLPPDAIRLLFASGTHTPLTPDEFPALLPLDILNRYPVYAHDCDDTAQLVHKGRTPRGTEVWINRDFDAADLRIVVGNLNPHQFMGYSGGVKGAAIGLAGRETISQNHKMLQLPQARLGVYDDNPVRQDVEDIGRLIGVHFALSLVLDAHKQVVHALAGDPLAVMRAGIPLVNESFAVRTNAPYDLVIASPGGHPKDIDIHQAQKALAHAAPITRDGGTVILVAACPEGSGGQVYEQWVAELDSHTAVLERFEREPFRMGPHKAFLIARDAARVQVRIVTQMPRDLATRLLLDAYPDLDAALGPVLAALPPGARIGVMPAANSTFPRT